MDISHPLTDDYATIVVSDEDFDSLGVDPQFERRNKAVRRWVDAGFCHRGAILATLDVRILRKLSEKHRIELFEWFNSLEATKGLGVQCDDFASFVAKAKSNGGLDLEGGFKVIYRMIRHVAAFPFEVNPEEGIDFDGFVRALLILSKTVTISFSFLQQGNLGPYRGTFVRRNRNPSDTRRMIFRALAIPLPSTGKGSTSSPDKVTSLDSNFEYTKVPITNFQYEHFAIIPPRGAMRQMVHVKRLEDERTVDARDILSLVYFLAEDPPDFMPFRANFDQVIPSLPTYKLNLDQLYIPWLDMLLLCEVLLLFQFQPTKERWFSAWIGSEAKNICREFLPADRQITWEIFNEKVWDEMSDLFDGLQDLIEVFCPSFHDEDHVMTDG